MYKVGEKVETPFGIGIVVGKRVAMRHDDIIFEVEIKGIKIDFRNTQVTPYQSAHDKLLAMGYVIRDTIIENNTRYDNGVASIYVDNEKKEYYCDRVNLTLSRILTQYLEELEAKE